MNRPVGAEPNGSPVTCAKEQSRRRCMREGSKAGSHIPQMYKLSYHNQAEMKSPFFEKQKNFCLPLKNRGIPRPQIRQCP